MGSLVWRLLALVCIMLGLVGIVLPLLPTVPFLIMAAAAASRGWPWLDRRLNSHATYGPLIARWRDHRAIPRAAKWFATLGMAGSATMLGLSTLPLSVRVGVILAMLAVGAWIWSRPDE